MPRSAPSGSVLLSVWVSDPSLQNLRGSKRRQAKESNLGVFKTLPLRFAESVRSHEKSVTLGFGDCDPASVIFYPRAFALAHAAVEELLSAVFSWDRWFASPIHACPVRHAEASFFLPMKPGEVFKITAATEKLGSSSLTFIVDFINAAGRTAASVRTVHVLVDKQSGRPAAIPREILAGLRKSMRPDR